MQNMEVKILCKNKSILYFTDYFDNAAPTSLPLVSIKHKKHTV